MVFVLIIKRKKITLTPSKKSEIYTKGPPVVLLFDFHRKINYILILKIFLSILIQECLERPNIVFVLI